MLSIFKKMGGYKNVHKILKESGWTGERESLFIQSYRGSVSAKVALILWEYCQKNNIKVSRQDFYRGA